MTAALRRFFLPGAALYMSLVGMNLLVAPALAQDGGRLRVQGAHADAFFPLDLGNLFAPRPAPGQTELPRARAVNAYAPEQHVRLKQTNFTGSQ